ncbi:MULTISPECIES: hypothetical protein [Klebsiella]|uniref:hypothetical protein n=1 Tax=Klebsiella TaxID=570 RepID=UPI001699FBB7|nr:MULTISPECIES: hypothetical protein [Klebsiella]EFJ8746324.1 hypothetical protein [Escherichia coli]EKY3945971.1 hypothetical protein [Enterobacter hormaechei]HCL6052269.1 hypothetical protein [Raoultella ornithinolytica]HED2155568.1 hypothetical protein [Klebsiella variicola subsp. variicola]HED2253949.1 hypothetical protein [Citrobacter freundii]
MKIFKILTPYEIELLQNSGFRKVVNESISTEGFLEGYNRLNNITFNLPKNGLEILIDQATGAGDRRIREYLNDLLPFIYRAVYLPLCSGFTE